MVPHFCGSPRLEVCHFTRDQTRVRSQV